MTPRDLVREDGCWHLVARGESIPSLIAADRPASAGTFIE
jgi:hypothetical protein